MIFANNNDTLRYRGIHPGLDIALEHITPEFLSGLGNERVELKGSDVYCFKTAFDTVPDNEAFFEGHRKYIDIHLVLEGIEGMDIALPEDLEIYEEHPDIDAYFYHGKGHHHVALAPGYFLVAFPEDAHKTKKMVGAPQTITKAVFKIRL